MNQRVLIIVGVIVIAAFFFGAPAVKRAITRGRVVGDSPKEDARGVIQQSPASLLASVNAELEEPVTLDDMSMARALRSEHGSEPEAVRRWVAWAIRNEARKRKRSIYNQLTRSSDPDTSGLFARQRADFRYAATHFSPRLSDIKISVAVLDADQFEDPTGGATNFFSPDTQDLLFSLAMAGDPRFEGRITRDADDQREKWIRDGLLPRGTPPGVDPGIVEFFGRAA